MGQNGVTVRSCRICIVQRGNSEELQDLYCACGTERGNSEELQDLYCAAIK